MFLGVMVSAFPSSSTESAFTMGDEEESADVAELPRGAQRVSFEEESGITLKDVNDGATYSVCAIDAFSARVLFILSPSLERRKAKGARVRMHE